MCQLQQNVYDLEKNVRIRWCSILDEDGDDTFIDINTLFQLSYWDTLDPNSILLEIPEVVNHGTKTFSLRKRDIVETKRLLKQSIKSETGESDESDDMMDLSTEPSATKKKRGATGKGKKHIHFSSSDDESDDDSSSGQEVPVKAKAKKRKTPSKSKKAPKEPAKKRVRKTTKKGTGKFHH